MFCAFQNRVICVFLNMKCSSNDCVAFCFKMLLVQHLSFNDLTIVNLNTHSMVSLYLNISENCILEGRFSTIANSDIFLFSEIQLILRLRNSFIVEELIRLINHIPANPNYYSRDILISKILKSLNVHGRINEVQQ